MEPTTQRVRQEETPDARLIHPFEIQEQLQKGSFTGQYHPTVRA